MPSQQETLLEAKAEAKRNKICAIGFVIVFTLSISIGLALYYTQERPTTPTPPPPPPSRREPLISCNLKNGHITQEDCEKMKCVWVVMEEENAPKCQFPAGYGYKMVGKMIKTQYGQDYVLSRIDKPTLFGGDIQTVRLQVEFINEYTVRLKFKDNNTERYEIPEEALPINRPENMTEDADRMYNVTVTNEPQFGITISRRDSGVVVFSSSLPGMVMSDQFHQLTTKLASGNVYGFGEHNHRRLQHDMEWKRWGIFTRDVAPTDDWNLYGAQPFYLNLEKDGKANGVFLRNSNAMDVILQPDPHPGVTFRVIGGVLDFFVFLGDSPDNVVQLYTEAVGRPIMPPYWSMGFQMSRWNYGNLSRVREVVERNREARIPQDVQIADIDYLYEKVDFTVDKENYGGLPEFIREMHGMGQKYIVILDHAIPFNDNITDAARNNSPGWDAYEDGLMKGIFVMDNATSGPLKGETWPGEAVFPDFTNPDSQEWWTKWCRFLYENESIEYDGLWLDMNEPSNFANGSLDGCDNNTLNYPPYFPKILDLGEEGKLFDKTLCMDANQKMGKHYDVHNLYGHTMAMRTYSTLKDRFPDKRPFTMTRSNFAGTQKYAIHWLGDNHSQWSHIPWSIVAMLEYSIFGFSMTGSDICGFWFATDEEMCTRWMQLGAFYPYSRNHNAKDFRDQDPASFSDSMIASSRSVLQTRYKFLPFLYTLLYLAHTKGSTVARPLFFEFPTDANTFGVDEQFMWGSGLLISPAMNKGQVKVDAYFPKARWYDYFTGEEVKGTGKRHILDTPLDKINLHVKGGSVIPWQEPDNTTVYSREKPMGLLISLDESSNAEGSLFWDDGESIITDKYLYLEFTVNKMGLKIDVMQNNYADAGMLFFKTIDLFGLPHRPSRIFVDGDRVPPQHVTNYNGHGYGTRITDRKLNITQTHTVTWEIF